MHKTYSTKWMAWVLVYVFMISSVAQAATVTLATAPLSVSTTTVVRPNLMYVLDDSGSMASSYTPDYIAGGNICWGPDLASPSSTIVGPDQAINCTVRYQMPWSSPDINYQHYNPAVRYVVPIKADGTSYPAASVSAATGVVASANSSWRDVFTGGAPTVNLTGNNWTHQVWCKASGGTSPTAANPTATGSCRENFDTTLSTNLWPSSVFYYPKVYSGPPYYFKMLPFEHCRDSALKNCVISPNPTVVSGVSYSIPSLFRWCASYNTTTNAYVDCQGDRDPNHTIPNYLGRVVSSSATPVAAQASLTVTGVANGLKINTLTVNGTNIFATGTTITANALSTSASIAQAICAGVYANRTTSGYTCAEGPSGPVASNTLTIRAIATGSTLNGLPIVVTGPAATSPCTSPCATFKSQGTITVPTATDAASGKSIDQIYVNDTPLLNANSPVMATGSTVTTASAICSAINSGPATSVYQASCPALSNTVTITRQTADSVDSGATVYVTGPAFSNTATKASGTLTLIATSGATQVDDVTVGGVSVLTGTKPVAFTDGTATISIASTLASRIGNGYTATSSSGVITITSTTTGSAVNGQAFVLQSTPAPATGIISVSAGATVPADLGGITVGGTTVVGHLDYTDPTAIIDGSKALENAQKIAKAINDSGTGFSAVNSGTDIMVSSPLGPTYNGTTFTFVNGSSGPQPSWTFNITNSTSTNKQIRTSKCGTVDTIRPNNVTSGNSSSARGRVNALGTSLQSNAQNGYVYSCPSLANSATVPPSYVTCTVTGPAGNASCSGFTFSFTDSSITIAGMSQTSPGGTLAWQNFAPLLSTTATMSGGRNVQSSTGSEMSGGNSTNSGTIGVATTSMTSGSSGTGTIITNATLPETLALADGADVSVKVRADTGNFQRVDIVTGSTYPKAPGPTGRTDCAGTVCNYTEELQNFANWYTYYSTRLTMMKSASTIAFTQLGGNYRVGFDRIRNYQSSSVLMPIAQFLDSGEVSNQRSDWWSTLMSTYPQSATPLRAEVSKIGRYYAGKLSSDPLQYSCQQNFTFLVTDGYWNEDDDTSWIKGISGSDIANQDNNLTKAGRPFYDGQVASTACPSGDRGNNASSCRTLADVTYYYYNTDLRDASLSNATNSAGIDVSTNNVKGSSSESNPNQRMNFFGMGLGVPGLLKYSKNYQTEQNGDYFSIRQGTKNWPAVANNDPTGSDDLWHASVNGRGKYFNANNVQAVSDGLNDALKSIQSEVGAASAAATSNLQPVAGDNFAYVASYATLEWVGDLQARYIDVVTGDVSADSDKCGVTGSGCIWSAQAKLDGIPYASRRIYMGLGSSNDSTPTLFSAMSLANQVTYLHPSSLSQYATASASYPTEVTPLNLLRYLSGDRTLEVGGGGHEIWRRRLHVLGDIVDSQPIFVKAPAFDYLEGSNPGYSAFKAANSGPSGRQGAVYVSANDGMLHAFDATTGNENWSFIPSAVLPNIKKLADVNYVHQYYVNGPSVVGDANLGSNSSPDWRTILVAGLGVGGNTYFAMDITDPQNPKYLWEFSDTNLGTTFGNPSINKLPSGEWAVLFSSGYNNINDGIGRLYAVAAKTGALITGYPISTGVGSAATPSNLGKISAWVDNLAVDNTATHVYGGDLLGNLWRFDLTTKSAFRLARLRNASSQAQPISAKPELALVGTSRVIYVGTGQYLGIPDLSDTRVQSLYAIKDTLGAPNLGGASQITWNPRTDTATILGVPGTRLFLENTLLSTRTDGTLILDASGNNIRKICRGAGSQVTHSMSGGTDVSTCTNESGPSMDWNTYAGWIIDFPDAGERMNVDMNLTLGTLTFPTNIPASNACSSGGSSWLNFVDYNSGLSVANATGLAGVKISGALIVGLNVIKLSSGAISAIVTTSDYKHLSVPPPVIPTTFQRKRSLWRELEVY